MIGRSIHVHCQFTYLVLLNRGRYHDPVPCLCVDSSSVRVVTSGTSSIFVTWGPLLPCRPNFPSIHGSHPIHYRSLFSAESIRSCLYTGRFQVLTQLGSWAAPTRTGYREVLHPYLVIVVAGVDVQVYGRCTAGSQSYLGYLPRWARNRYFPAQVHYITYQVHHEVALAPPARANSGAIRMPRCPFSSHFSTHWENLGVLCPRALEPSPSEATVLTLCSQLQF